MPFNLLNNVSVKALVSASPSYADLISAPVWSAVALDSIPFSFVWSEFFKNDDAFLAHLVNPTVGDYLEAHAGIIDGDVAIEFYGTVGDKVFEVKIGSRPPFYVFKIQLGIVEFNFK